MSLNFIALRGRLTKDPELRRTPSGVAVTSFTIAVDRDYVPQGQDRTTDFIDCVAWRKTGEFVEKYFSKGSMIIVTGRLQQRNFTDKEGNKRRAYEVNANEVDFGEGRRRDGGNGQNGGYSSYNSNSPAAGSYPEQKTDVADQNAAYSAYPTAPNYEEIVDDDAQLPF